MLSMISEISLAHIKHLTVLVIPDAMLGDISSFTHSYCIIGSDVHWGLFEIMGLLGFSEPQVVKTNLFHQTRINYNMPVIVFDSPTANV